MNIHKSVLVKITWTKSRFKLQSNFNDQVVDNRYVNKKGNDQQETYRKKARSR